VVLPLLGPSNLRDIFGKIPDYFLDPLTYYDNTAVAVGISAGDRINMVSLRIGEYESLRKDAVDLYLFLRNAYEKNRKKQIEE
jgi:phospholipid-binding lipoprotein MlaA